MTVRTYEIEKPRIDTEVEGNRGFLLGTPEDESKESRLGPNRKVSVVEIEFGSRKEQASSQEPSQEAAFIEEDVTIDEAALVEELAAEEAEGAYTLYTVKKNDTLQKISHKFYGTTRRWKFLYNHNKDVLKSPDKLYPGVKIKVPALK